MARSQKHDADDRSPRDLGRYRLHGEIAAGGMATVHFGRQIGGGGFAKTVAIKRLHPQFAKIPEFVTMFMAEAKLAARIRHPNVVQPLDVLELDDEIFLVMEYVDGDSLSRLMKASLARKERVPLPIAVSILCGVLHGLHAAHEAKSDTGQPLDLVHRDVSPQNILVGVDGVPRVIDFGIAKAADSVQITREGELKGKLSYMAPEQLNGERVTRKIDIYAASVVLWEVLTGQRLFDADYQSAILKNILHRPVDAPSEIADLPSDLDPIVLKGLAKDPKDRFATAREMALALEDRIVLANPSQIGSWVEKVAVQSLTKRSERIAEIESVPSGATGPKGAQETEEIVSEMILVERTAPSLLTRSATQSADPGTLPWKRTGQEPPPPPVSRASLPTAPTAAQGALAAARQAMSSTLPPQRPLPSTPSPETASRPPPPTINVPEGPLVAPAWPVPGILPAPQGTAVEPHARKRSQGGGTALLLFVIAAAIAGFYFVLPELIKRGYVASAAREGYTLVIADATLTLHSVHLEGVTVAAAEIPGVTLRARSVDMRLRKFDPVEMNVHDVVINADGQYPALHDAILAFVTEHRTHEDPRGELEKVSLESGKLAWSRPFGEGTRVDVENLSAFAERQEGHALGDDVDVLLPIVSLTTSSLGKSGPWRAKWHREPLLSKASLVLDPVSRSEVTATLGDAGVLALDAVIARVPLPQLGVSATAFGRQPADPLTVEGSLKYTASGPRVQAEIHLGALAARLAGATSAADVTVDGKVDGDPAQAMEVRDGALSFGPFRGRLGGAMTLAPSYVKADLTWKGGPIRCGASEQTVAGTIHWDSRSLDDTSVTLVPSAKCGMRIFAP